MKNIICLVLTLILVPLTAFSKENAKNKKKLTPEQIFERCEKLSELKRKKYEKICEQAESKIKAQYFPFTSLRVGVDYYLTDISAEDKNTGGKLDLVSNSNVKLNVQYLQHYSRNFKTYLGMSYQDIRFNNDLTYPLVNPNTGLWSFGGGLIFNFGPRVYLDLGAAYEEQFYVRAAPAPLSASNLKLDKYATPHFKLKVGGDIYSHGDLDIGVAGEAGLALPFEATDRDDPLGNYDVKMGYYYGGEVFARKQMDNVSLIGAVNIRDTKTETSVTKASQVDVGFIFKIAIPFGWNKVKGE